MEKIDWKYEAISLAHTFIGVFVGILLASPIINAIIGSDLPTISQFKDIEPVMIDALYRAAWMTLLAKLGLRNVPVTGK